jgi:hypothetical protein
VSIPKSLLKERDRFHLVSPDELDGIEEYAEWLEALLHNSCSIFVEDDGEEYLLENKKLVARLNGLKIEIYPDEHVPPHFHVKSPNINASFSIESCSKLEGKISGKDLSKIRYWYKHSKPLLINIWNSTRPSNCEVGEYTGN